MTTALARLRALSEPIPDDYGDEYTPFLSEKIAAAFWRPRPALFRAVLLKRIDELGATFSLRHVLRRTYARIAVTMREALSLTVDEYAWFRHVPVEAGSGRESRLEVQV